MNEKRNELIERVNRYFDDACEYLGLASDTIEEIAVITSGTADLQKARLDVLAQRLGLSLNIVSKKLAKISADEAKAAAKVERDAKTASKKEAKLVNMRTQLNKLQAKIDKAEA